MTVASERTEHRCQRQKRLWWSCSLESGLTHLLVPVLTLDNSESLEATNYGRGAYFNPALQMTTLPPRYNAPGPDGYTD